ncbi:NADP-dependent oxidoreductase domain-containing protein [Amylostereum chailletii]|nr:NADP-dependent oxidoreductase domain-containing protein [Amylostereum chailletii]
MKIALIPNRCWMGYVGKEGEREVREMITNALEVGYRHIDTATTYGNESQVGRAILASGVPREQLFITTKLWSDDHGRVRAAFDESLEKLGCGYIDLYLMHWPQATREDGTALPADEYPTIVDTWKEMEALLVDGKVKSIGVSNFSVKTFEQLLPHVTVVPAINQVEMHPLLPQLDLLAYCTAKNIRLTAYTPLAKHKPEVMSHPAVVQIAERKGCTAAQAVLSWLVQKGVVVIPKTKTRARMVENLGVRSSPHIFASYESWNPFILIDRGPGRGRDERPGRRASRPGNAPERVWFPCEGWDSVWVDVRAVGMADGGGRNRGLMPNMNRSECSCCKYKCGEAFEVGRVRY